jgi:membrane protein DedA with SNARE-associated domain
VTDAINAALFVAYVIIGAVCWYEAAIFLAGYIGPSWTEHWPSITELRRHDWRWGAAVSAAAILAAITLTIHLRWPNR